jgi:hypothetical protein
MIGPNRPPSLHLLHDVVSQKNTVIFPFPTAIGASTVVPARRWPSPTQRPHLAKAFPFRHRSPTPPRCCCVPIPAACSRPLRLPIPRRSLPPVAHAVLAVTNNQIRPPIIVQNRRNRHAFDTYAFTIDLVPLVLEKSCFAGHIFEYKWKTYQKAQTEAVKKKYAKENKKRCPPTQLT